MTDLKTELTDFAAALLKEANSSGDSAPTFAEKVEALEQVTKLYIAFQRHPGDTEDDPGGFDFSKGVQTPGTSDVSSTPRLQPRRRPPSN